MTHIDNLAVLKAADVPEKTAQIDFQNREGQTLYSAAFNDKVPSIPIANDVHRIVFTNTAGARTAALLRGVRR